MALPYITPAQLEKAVEKVESKIPVKEVDPYRLTEQITITSYEELKPYIIHEDTVVYVDFKGKNVLIQIIADDEHWVKDENDNWNNWKYLYIVGQLYLGMIPFEDISSNMGIDEIGIVFGVDYYVSSILVAIVFSEELTSQISVIDRLVSCSQEY